MAECVVTQACLLVWTFLLSVVEAVKVEAPCSESDTVRYLLKWDSRRDTAEELAEKLKKGQGTAGLYVHTTTEGIDAGLHDGTIRVRPSSSHKWWLPWQQVAGFLHAVAATYTTPDEIFDIELRSGGGTHFEAPTGLFLFMSFGRAYWRTLCNSIRRAWKMTAWHIAPHPGLSADELSKAQQGLLLRARLHVMVHQVETWNAQAWRQALGEAAPALGGLHWCDGPNRFKKARRLDNNYIHKMYTMIALSEKMNYKYITCLDDDVLLPASALAFLVASGPDADAYGCGVVLPLFQNGIPSTELWAETFLDGYSAYKLYECFEGSSARWLSSPYKELEPLPKPWHGADWYKRLEERLGQVNKGVHPVRGNNTCMGMALDMALALVVFEWPKWREDLRLFKDHTRMFPYFVNYAFTMRADLYAEAIETSDLEGGSDEEPLNMFLKRKKMPMCFVANSFGIHPAYSTHPDRAELETRALEEVQLIEEGQRRGLI
eukprot:TRINITY_DN52269_c0_g2_i1.p1 TRINITY_DN52269_c0_g2~~TRINITY_DN52269_c0_g2_i1.p1  ORF type:complete len:557 (-),score=58.36 TRINITY_DN52269_c0_g2_i1:9-1478(-)